MSIAWSKQVEPHDAVWSHIRALERRHLNRIWRSFVNERIYGSTVGVDAMRGMAAADLPASLARLALPPDVSFLRRI